MITSTATTTNHEYPTSDGKPMAETDYHRDLMNELIDTLQQFCADDPMTYVSGNLLLYYVPGNKRKHVSPDVFVVRDVAKKKRINYLTWEEGKGPDFVIELTSSSTRKEDIKDKYKLYRDVLKVREYFIFDPRFDYLDPPMQGFRLDGTEYVPIEAINGRLASEVLKLHLERIGHELRLYDPATETVLPTPAERADTAEATAELESHERQEAQRQVRLADRRWNEAKEAIIVAEQERQKAEQARKVAEDELARLQAEMARLRGPDVK